MGSSRPPGGTPTAQRRRTAQRTPSAAVLGYNLWQARFEGDPSVLGRSILVGNDAHTVVGVMPPGFAFPQNEELWTALQTSPPRLECGAGLALYVFGRLAPGATREQAQAEITTIGDRAAADFPETTRASARGSSRTLTRSITSGPYCSEPSRSRPLRSICILNCEWKSELPRLPT